MATQLFGKMRTGQIHRKTLALIALLFLVSCGSAAYAGTTPGTLSWSYATGGVVLSSPAVGTDGTVYVGSGDNNLYAINPDGTFKWSYPTTGAILSSPAIGADGTIYVGSADGLLYLFLPTGTLKQTINTGTAILTSPAIGSDGTVYIGTPIGTLFTFNPNSGSNSCGYRDQASFSSPSIGPDGTIYVGSLNHALYAVNPDCSLKWTYTTGNGVYAPPAVGADGTIYVGSGDANLYAINPDGTLKWSYATTGAILSSPSIGPDGAIFVGSDDDSLYAINANGTLKWSYAPTTKGDSIQSSPAIGADGTIYVGSMNGSFYAVKADGTLSWTYATGASIKSSPLIAANGTIYVGSQDNSLYAIYSASPGLAVSPWPMYRHDSLHTANTVTLPPSGLPVLTVVPSGTGSGTVTSVPAGISCGTVCSASFAGNTLITLTPVAATGSVFAGWTGACTGTGTCTIAINGNQYVGALFNESTCTYTLSPVTRTVAYSATSYSVSIKATGATSCPTPAVSAGAAWLVPSSLVFKNNSGSVKISVLVSNSSEDRNGTVTIAGTPEAVKQTGQTCTLTVNRSFSSSFPKAGGIGSFYIKITPSDCAWTAAPDKYSTWLTLTSSSSGAGPAAVNFQIASNPGGYRSGSIVVTATKGKKTATVTVIQKNR